MNKQVITKIQRLENKERNAWGEFELGAEASNIFVRNGNGVTETAQSLLLKNLESIEYTYGQDIWDANNEVIEQLTWENIQKWLNEGRINDFLKEGDCIVVTTDINMSSIPNEEVLAKYHFYVIGINRHNGQDINDLELNHIDFCGGSMVQLGRRFRIDNNITGKTEYNFAYMPSNNGGEENNNTYGNYFVDGIFSVENPIKSPVQCLEEICNNVDIPISNKKLYLDARYSPVMDFMNYWAGNSDNNIVNDVNDLLKDLAQIYNNILEDNSINLLGKYETIIRGLAEMNEHDPAYHPIDSDLAVFAARGAVDFWRDDFLEEVKNSEKMEISTFALDLLRFSLLPSIDLDTPEGVELLQQIIGSTNYDNYTNALEDIFHICKQAYQWIIEQQGYKMLSKKSNNYPLLPIWSLTEKEFFGECTFSNAEYAQGQIFQYPIFNDLSFRKKITRDLSRSSGGICNMVTLTPVENSNTEVAGMDPDTLMPVAASILKTNTYTPDTPICFRMQERSNEELVIDGQITF